MTQEAPTIQPEFHPPAESTSAATPAPAKPAARVKGLILFGLAFVVSAVLILVTTHYRHEIQSLGNAGYLGLFVVSLIGNATIVIPAPVFVMACAAGMVYGPIQVGVISGLGAALGELTGYYAGRGGAAVLPAGKLYLRLEDFMRRHGMLAIFLLAAIPNPLFDVGGMIAGVLRMPAIKFVIAAWLGKAVRLSLLAFACMGGIPLLEQLITPR